MSDDVSTNLVLNVSPVYFDNAEVRVGIVEYQGREHLRDLRSEHNATHVFYREEGTRILCVPVVPDAPEIGNCNTTIRLANNLYLSAALVRNALINYFHKLGQQILTYNPIKFIAVGSSNNLLAASVPKGVPYPPELAVRVLYEMNVRVFKLDHQQPFIGLALDIRTARLIKYPCAKLIDEGFPLNGLYVGRFVARDDARMASRFELLGRIQNMQQKQLFLTDERAGFGSIHASEVVLESRYRAFDLCLTHVFRERTTPLKIALCVT